MITSKRRYKLEILRVEHLSKIYGSGETAVKALDDISFSVNRGDLLLLLEHQVQENQHYYIC